MAFKLAELFVNIGANMAPLQSALKETQSSLTRLASKPISLGGLATGAGIAAVGYGVKKAVEGASNLNETLSKTGVVFGQSADVVTSAADDMAKRFGIPKREMLDAASALGLMAKGAGQSQKEAADFSVSMSKLAMDAASFYNVPLDQALEKIRSGLSGESEPLRAFGVFLTEDAVKAQALAMGLSQTGDKLTEGQKIMARSALIMQGLGDAQGDLERTSGGYSNQTRELWGRLQNLADQIGTTMLPAFTDLITIVNDTLDTFTSDFGKMQSVMSTFVGYIKTAIGTIGVIYRNWGLIVERTGIMIGGAWVNLQETIAWLGQSIKVFLNWFATNWQSIFLDAFNGTLAALTNLAKNFKNFGKAAWDWITGGFKTFDFKGTALLEGHVNQTTPLELPKRVLSNVADQVREIDEKMAGNEKQFADNQEKAKEEAKKAETKKATPANLGTPKAKEAQSSFIGLTEFAKNIQQGALGGENIQKAILAESKEQTMIWKTWIKDGKKRGNFVAVAG